jgi:hypothetical protein
MKILSEGAIPMPPPLWPIDFGFECYRCHCKFAFEEGDTVRQETERRPHGKSTLTVSCPCCDISLQAIRPDGSCLATSQDTFSLTAPAS